MKLLTLIRSSIYNPHFYKSLLEKPMRFSWQYFFSLVVVLALISAVVFSFGAVPAANSFFSSLIPKVVNYYPDGLEVTFKDGVASSNVQEPYIVPLPAPLMTDEFNKMHSNIKNLIVIDTKDTFNRDTFNYGALIVLNRDTLSYYDDQGQARIQLLDKMPNTTLTKSSVAGFMQKAQPFLKGLTIALPFLIFFGMFFFYASTLITILIWALLVWGLAKMKKLKIGYGKAYQIAMHAATLGMLVDAVIFLLLPGVGIPFLSTILLLFVTWFNLFKRKEHAA